MKSVIIYIIIMVILGIRSYLQNKAKQEQPIPQESDEDEFEDDTDEEAVETVERHLNPQDHTEEIKRKRLEEFEQFAPKESHTLSEEAQKSKMFEEGSSRIQHSTQYENAPSMPARKHDIHPDYNKEEANGNDGIELNAENIRQAIIYQTIIERPNY